MCNIRLDDSQAGIKISRIIINLNYEDDTTLMAEIEEELKSLFMRVKEESEKDGFKLNSHKTKIVASCPITLWLRRGTSRSSERFSFFGLQDHC